ncbi:hypothetical protein IAR55_000055 [Kwoniella newhampshirensis]|uniref:Zn(2)-C6 fungal-type domain-containing protein n=1 Tax=Kwoniella newhampshirensis TaxID=1651941 RepID=A0AAW0Z642_9TREE
MPKTPSEKSVTFADARRNSIQSSLSITCAPCRAKKIKCDSTKPTCINCNKNPQECHYPPKLKPGLRPGTGLEMIKRVEMLEDRIETYEARLADQEARLSQLPIAGPSFTYDQSQTPLSDALLQPNPNTYNTINSGISNPLAPPNIPPSIPSTISNPPMSNSNNPFPTDPSPTTSGVFDHAGFNISTSPGINISSPSSFLDPNILPPDDIVRDLLALFFTHIHPWAPILSPTIPDFHPPWNIVHHAIVVVTLRLSKDPRLTGSKVLIKQRAKQHVLAHAIESTSIASIQALGLLALDLIGSEQGPSSWGILALLTRSAVHLGLAIEEDSNPWIGRAPVPSLSRTIIIPPSTSWHEDESRRRLFWLIFCLDRYACVSTGWDFALPDFDIRRRLPCSDLIWAQPDWYQTPPFRSVLHRDPSELDLDDVSPMAYLVEALDLLGRAHTLQSQMLEPGDARGLEARKDMTMTLTTTAKRWFVNLPLDRINQVGLKLMILTFSTLLKLNAYHAYPALSNGEPQEPYVSTCLASARSVAALAESARPIGWATASTPLFIWGCWVAARVLFGEYIGSKTKLTEAVHAFLNHQSQPDDDFNTIVVTLKEQAEYWGLANQYVKLLERAKRKWQNANNSSGSTSSLPDAIHVLLDLRRTAYSAVHTNTQATPHVSPPDPDLSHLPAWAVQPGLGDLYSWFDLPAGLFQNDSM